LSDLPKKGDLSNSIKYGEQSLKLAQQIKALEYIKESSESLFTSYLKKGNHKKAFELQELFYKTRDSILSTNNQQEILKQELTYKYEKDALTDSINYANQKKLAAIENEAKFKSEKIKDIRYTLDLFIVIRFFRLYI